MLQYVSANLTHFSVTTLQGSKKRNSMVAALSGIYIAEMLKFPRKEKGKRVREIEGKGKEEKERRRERIQDRMKR